MNAQQVRTLKAVFEDPVRSNINWKDIENLFLALGARVSEREGSRLAVYLNGTVAIFHRPHPEKETDKGALKSVRRFLIATGIQPPKEKV
jgi:hypothetical protein